MFNINEKTKNGAISGLMAGAVQTTTIMPLKTTLNYQYTNGVSTKQAIANLFRFGGGISRFYKGFAPALILNSASRFGETLINTSVMENTSLPLYQQTALSSILTASYRSLFMPLDVIKTNLQVKGNGAIKSIKSQVRKKGIRYFWNGTMPQCAATMVGHYPWYFIYNYLNKVSGCCDVYSHEIVKQGMIGFTASFSADIFVNGFKVLKATRQTTLPDASYRKIFTTILKNEGIFGFYRGFKTKIIINGCNGMLFSVCWKIFKDNIGVSV